MRKRPGPKPDKERREKVLGFLKTQKEVTIPSLCIDMYNGDDSNENRQKVKRVLWRLLEEGVVKITKEGKKAPGHPTKWSLRESTNTSYPT